MSQQDITPKDALLRLGGSTAEAIEQVLETLAPGQIERGEVSVLPDGASAFAKLPAGAIATSVSYVDGVTGANIFVVPPAGARKLAQAMGVPPSEDGEESALAELELSAVAEAANQMMAAAASAIGAVLGHEVDISPPDTRVLDDPARDAEKYGTAPHAASTTFMIAGESCRLIQLVPSAFVVRMVRAIDELSATGPSDRAGSEPAAESAIGLRAALGETRLRVWAELGRTRMPLGRALTLPLGAVVDLDQDAEDAVELFVNGVPFARGHLIVQGGEWALRIDELIARSQASEPQAESIEQPEGALT